MVLIKLSLKISSSFLKTYKIKYFKLRSRKSQDLKYF